MGEGFLDATKCKYNIASTGIFASFYNLLLKMACIEIVERCIFSSSCLSN